MILGVSRAEHPLSAPNTRAPRSLRGFNDFLKRIHRLTASRSWTWTSLFDTHLGILPKDILSFSLLVTRNSILIKKKRKENKFVFFMIAAFVSFDKVKGLERKTRAERKIDRMTMFNF